MSEKSLRGHFRNLQETSEGFKADCPACDDAGRRFAFNEEKRVGCCFHAGCMWYYERGGVTETRLEAFFSKNGIPYRIPDEVKKVKGETGLPEEYEPIDELPRSLRDDLYLYLKHRDLHQKIVRAAHVGYCQKGKLWGYMIFPVLDEEGVVQYWQARRYKNREPKFRNPTSSKKTELVYQLGTASKPDRIVLVESIINTMTITSLASRKNLVLGIFGKTLSELQRDYVLKYERWVTRIVVALDGPQEKDNTKHSAVQIAKMLEGRASVEIAKFPEGEDINSVGREKSWDIIDRAVKFQKNVNESEFLYGDY